MKIIDASENELIINLDKLHTTELGVERMEQAFHLAMKNLNFRW